MKTKMKPFIKGIFFSAGILIFILPVDSAGLEAIPPLINKTDFTVEFNKDSLKGFCLVLDFRTYEEKKLDTKRKSTAGDVIVFTNGHSQRVDDAMDLTRRLASDSKSGIVIVPVCDTPFGEKSEWRGDRGKEVILMEITRFMLRGMGISIKNFKPLTEMKVFIDKQDVSYKSGGSDPIECGLSLMGWSHGALLARRLAYSYPDSVNSLVQMAPAGFASWGEEYCVGTSCIISSFGLEGSCISLGVFRGESGHIFGASWGFTRGLFGDTARSCTSCFSGNFSLLKPFRPYKDIKDCTLYADDKNLPVSKLKNITVIFAVDDTLFEYDDHGGIKDPKNITQRENDLFFEKFYPAAVKSGAKCILAALPGNHIGPLVNSGKFSDKALESIGQKAVTLKD